MILQVRIPGDLQTRFSELRILKGLRAYIRHRASWCKSRSSAKLLAGFAPHVTATVIAVNGKLSYDKENAQNSQSSRERTGKVANVSASVVLLFVSDGSCSIRYSGCGLQAWSLHL